MQTCKNCIHSDICIIDYALDEPNPCDYFKSKSKIIELPVPIGTDLYKIDTRIIKCLAPNPEKDELLDRFFNYSQEYYIFEIKNADAMTILGNKEYLGTRVFTSREEAEKRIKELNDNTVENN